MGIKKKIRVLVVDDSMLFTEVLVKGLTEDVGIEVVGTAKDPYEARDKIIELRPDVMTLDVNMPRMSGIEFLKKLMPQYPMPVVVVSAVDDIVFDALNAGAVDFVSKPNRVDPNGVQSLVNELAVKIKIASISKVGHWKHRQTKNDPKGRVMETKNANVIAIGASTGGTEAIYNVIKQFPRDIPGTVIVQHMPPVFTKMYAERMNNQCLVEVCEAKDGDVITQGKVLIAPGDAHMKVVRKNGQFQVKCFKGDKVSGHMPSVDVLFDSVADAIGEKAIGVILTGMGSDGAKGLKKMRENKALTIGQNEESCIVYGMPKAAYDQGAVEYQLELKEIANHVIELINKRK